MEKKLSKKALFKAYNTWLRYCLTSLGFERLMSFSFCQSMVPIIEELYGDNEEEKKAALKRHSGFFCTEPQVGVIIHGIIAGLEEKRANGQDIDDEVINGLKVGLMGPIAGIGDSMIPGLLIPVLLSIGMGLSASGSILGPIFYIVVYNAIIFSGSWFLFKKGYMMGTESVKSLVGETANRVKESFAVLGVFVVGAVAASYVNLSTKFQYSYDAIAADGITKIVNTIKVQEILDGIFPKLIPLLIVLFTYWLMDKKRMSPIKTMLILFIVSALGVLVGLF